MKFRLLLIIMLLCALAVSGCGQKEVAQTPQQQVPVKQKITASTPIDIDDFSLKDVKVGDSVSSVVQKFGEPKSKKQKQDGLSYDYGDIEVIINSQNTIINILTDQNAVSTRRDIHPGSSLNDVKQAYGESYNKTDLGDLELYEYTFAPTPQNSHVLRFAINKSSNTVNYIGCRILAAVEKKVFTGKWKSAEGISFYLELNQNDSEIEGRHSIATQNANRIDTGRDRSIKGKIYDGEAVVEWKSGRDGTTGTATIKMLTNDKLAWKITRVNTTPTPGRSDHLFPQEAVLYRQ